MSPGIIGNTTPAYPSLTIKRGDCVDVLKSIEYAGNKVLVYIPNGKFFAHKGDAFDVICPVSQQLSTGSLLNIFVQKDAKVRVTNWSGDQVTYDGPYKLFPASGCRFNQSNIGSKNYIVALNHHVEVSKSADTPGKRVLLHTRNSSLFARQDSECRVIRPSVFFVSYGSLLSITVEADAQVTLVIHDQTSGEEIDEQTCLGPCNLFPVEGHRFYEREIRPSTTA